MGSRDAAHGQQGGQRIAALLLSPLLALTAAACGGDDGDGDATVPVAPTAEASPETTQASPSTLPPCSAARHLVAFDVFGTLSLSDEDVVAWIQDPANDPDPRPGAAHLAATYRSLGYEIWYVTTMPVGVGIGDQPLGEPG